MRVDGRSVSRAWWAPLVVTFACVVSATVSGRLFAQAPGSSSPIQAPKPSPPVGAAATKATPASDRLPVRRVVLYKSGVGYFEHLGRVHGDQSINIDFTSGQLDDVLSSLTTIDLDGGRVSGVSYNSEAALDRRIGALRLPIGQQPTRAQFLSALRGAKLDVGSSSGHVIGRLLSVERVQRRRDGVDVSEDALSIVTDAGEMESIALDPGVTVRIIEADLNREVGQYLSLVASARDQDVRRLTIATAGAGDRDLFVSYVSEVPVWKATYRLVMPAVTDTRKPLLQGWAIVDNTVGEDWENVELSLVAGAPQSFVQSISRPYYVQRPIVPLPRNVLMSPQTHQSALSEAGPGALAGTVTDSRGGVLPGVAVRVTKNGARVAEAITDSTGRYRFANLAPDVYDVTITLTGFRTYSRPSVSVSAGMETVLSATLNVGNMADVTTATAGVDLITTGRGGSANAAGGRGGGGGRGGAVSGLPQSSISIPIDDVNVQNQQFKDEQGASQSLLSRNALNFMEFLPGVDATASAIGDLFEYTLKQPVTIRKNQSALVPILGGNVEAERVSLWTPSSGIRPLRAVWLTNTLGVTLDAGSVSLIDGDAFAGEAMIDALKAGERRLVSYAMDTAMQVTGRVDNVPTRVTKVHVSHGVVVQTTEIRQESVYTARNDGADARVLVIEHPLRPNWKLADGMKPTETTTSSYRFRVDVAPKTTVTFAVDEVQPGHTDIAVSSVTDDQVALLVKGQSLTPEIEAALREVLKRKTEIGRLTSERDARQTEINTIAGDEERIRANMAALKGTAEEKQLVQRYVKQLDDQENRLAVLRKELAVFVAQVEAAQLDLNKFIEGLAIG